MAHSDSGAEDSTSTASMSLDITEEQALETDPDYGDGGGLLEDEGVVMPRMSTSTCTITTDQFKYIERFGRTYDCDDKYLLPNDEKEMDRLDLQHKLWLITLHDKLHLAPIQDTLHAQGGGKVLDMCTGTGIWAIDFADEYESAHVTGKDLSPIQPIYVPPNLEFIVDDVEDEWPLCCYDFIHGRMLCVCFKEPVRVINDAVIHLNPGGFLEIQDVTLSFECDNGSPGPEMEKWQKMLHEAVEKAGRNCLCPTKYEQYMKSAGLVNVTEVKYQWPINRWPVDEHKKEIGMFSLENLLRGLEGFSLIMMKELGTTKEEMDEIVTSLQREIRNQDIHAYLPVTVIYGQKPL